MSQRPPRLRLFDILDCIGQIESALQDVASPEQLTNDVIRYRAVERWLEIISEASRHLTAEMKASEPSIEWKQIAAFGNIVRHGYEFVDHQIIWNIAKYDLPRLKEVASRLYAAVKEPADPWPDAGPK